MLKKKNRNCGGKKERGMEKKRVCVTGAGGFVASWLVKLLLSKGYFVNGTVRDPSDKKNVHLKKLDKASENLQLFKADLLDYHTVAAAIAGCEGVFHVASPDPPTKVPNPEVELIAPAVEGTLNVLKACSEAKIERAVVVSSVFAVFQNPNWPLDKLMDEECWSDLDYCRTNEKWYEFSKTMAEAKALDYATKHGLDVVTLCPPFLIGPLLQSALNTSSLIFINMLKGDPESVENEVWPFADVRDVADALLLLYEKPEASGRYVCAPNQISFCDLFDMIKGMFPDLDCPKKFTEVDERPLMTSVKLEMLGWKSKPLKEILGGTIEFYKEAGY